MKRTSIWLSNDDREVLAGLMPRYGTEMAEVIRFSIRFLAEHGPLSPREETMKYVVTETSEDGEVLAGHWQCQCGGELPPALGRNASRSETGNGKTISCPACGQRYRYGYWPLDRWPGDQGSTPLEPRPC